MLSGNLKCTGSLSQFSIALVQSVIVLVILREKKRKSIGGFGY